MTGSRPLKNTIRKGPCDQANGQVRTAFLAGGGEMGSRIGAFDWTSTPLGPIERWPQCLKTSVSLILTSRHPMWIGWGPEMTFLYNDAYQHVLGPAKHPSALGRPASEVWGEIWDICGPLANRVLADGEATFVDDVRLFMDRGDYIEETFYSFSYSPIRDEFGQVFGLFCPSTDVTPKVINARRLRTLSELASNALVERTTAGACETAARTLAKNPDDIPFTLLYLADASGQRGLLEQGVGRFDDPLMKAAAVDLNSAADESPWRVAEVFQSGKRQVRPLGDVPGLPPGLAQQPVSQAVVLPVTSRGEHRPYGVLVAGVNPCRPLDDEHLTFFELLASQVATAIQTARAIEEEKKRADMLAELDRAKTAFFSNVSHEFRTPLTLMLGPLENLLARRDNLRAEDQEDLAIAHRNSLRLLKLVNSLLDFSRIEAGRSQASYAPIDLPRLTTDLASNFRSAMQAAGLELIVDCPPLPEPVYVDIEMWEKIVLNLLSNAFKFTFEGRIVVQIRHRDGNAVLTISDTGIGIAEAELPRIFERFHRIEGARGRTYEGTGIGLALIQELVKLHGGSTVAASVLGEGSTFTVSLPFGAAHLPKEHVEAAASGRVSTAVRAQAYTEEALTWVSGKGHGAKPAVTGTRTRILLADDNADMREHVANILGQEYDVVVAEDGRQVLDLIRQDPPDLLITDIMMPGLDGFGLLRAVREADRTRTLPVIFISARAGEEMQVEGLQAGADDYLVKPFTANELRARVAAHVQMALARRRAAEKEAALRAEAEAARDRVTDILESITDGFVALDRGWRLTYVNTEAEQLMGLRRDELVGRSYWELFPGSTGTVEHLAFLRAAASRATVEFEDFYPIWKRWLHVKAYPGSDGAISVFYEDITDRKAAEEALEKSEERFRGVFESSAVGVAILSLDGRFLQVNQAFCAITGYVEGELRDFGYERLTHPEDRRAPEPLIGQLTSGEVPTFVSEQRYFTKHGQTIWVQISASALRDASGRPELLIALCEDITARKRAEAALRESEERFRTIVNTTPECVKVVAADGTLLHMNSSGLAMIGADQAEAVIGENVYALIAPEYRESFREFNEKICGGENGSLEFDVIGLQGQRRHMETHAAPLRNPDGTLAQLAITHDITERRRAESATLLLGAIVDSSDDAIISKDLNGIITSWNQGAERLFGYTAQEAVGRSITLLIPPDRLGEEPEILSRLQRAERIEHFETLRRHKNGTLINISLTISPIRNVHGNVIGASKIARDITDRKRTERAIQTLNTQLTAELSAMARMQQLSTRLVQAEDFELLLGEIIDAGMEITHADMGTIQLSEDDSLKIVSHRGFDRTFLDYFNTVHPGFAACGAALERGGRVIIEDVAKDPLFVGTVALDVLLTAGVRAVQSTPLVSRSGQILGVFSTHYRSPHQPGDREVRMLDVLARQAADLVERKRAEAALLGSESRFRQLADSMPQIVWTARPDGYVDYYNERWFNFTGFDRDKFGDRSWEPVLHPDDLDRTRESWYNSVGSGDPFRIEYRFWDRQETRWRWFMGRALPVHNAEGEIVKWFGSCTDIDDQKRVEDELRHANQDLEQFAYSASHDLQEPLRGIKIYSQLLTQRYRSHLDGQALEFLEYLRGSASRMEMLVRDLLAYTHVTTVDAPEGDADANAALEEALANLNSAIVESGAHITCDALPALRVHDTHLKQLFQNLVGNAIKYRSPERVPAVHVTAERQDGSWRFAVIDNGMGIEPEYKERIFGLFKRLHSGDEYSGTGIGLAICQRIVERYHGRIWVESEPGKGSRFNFTLPV